MQIRDFFLLNSWWGKLLGAFFGFLIAGPLGAFLGILVGNFFDKGMVQHFGDPFWYYHSERQASVKRHFFEATFIFLGYIAKADGRVSQDEIDGARDLMQAMRLNNREKTLAKQLFSKGKSAAFNIDQVLSNLFKSCYNKPELLKLFINLQYNTAQIDGFSQKKIEALNAILRELGFAPLTRQNRFYDDFSYHSSEYSHRKTNSSKAEHSYNAPTLASSFELLNVNSNASKQEVKKAYRRLISLNHPDKLVAKGLSASAIKEANEKTQKIRKAYEQICITKGWQH